jgi:hypothetical protein
MRFSIWVCIGIFHTGYSVNRYDQLWVRHDKCLDYGNTMSRLGRSTTRSSLKVTGCRRAEQAAAHFMGGDVGVGG